MKPIEASVETKISSSVIWKKWKEAQPWNHWGQESSKLAAGQKGHVNSKNKSAISYKILEVKENESFTIAWKALFIRLVFTYSVKKHQNFSLVIYSVKIKGLFSLPIYFLIRNKIKKSLVDGLNSFIKQIEN